MIRHLEVVAFVEDDIALREALVELLKAAGFRTLSFGSGLDLLGSADLHLIDCLVSDVGLPGINGFVLRQRLGAARPEMPVILITGERALLELDQHDVSRPGTILSKPFDGSELLKAVEVALAARRSSR
ncbi:response regulator transcription factor [Acuticoccus sediminis]|uniref:response regulator transcription factor n=1 Tax=Acuticoccus sediminis TaxID=2184697 RepID=UPI001CFCD4A7|nr:response regulator [Acuticoccus sediminis]